MSGDGTLLRAAIERIAHGLLVLDARGTVIHINARASELLGVKGWTGCQLEHILDEAIVSGGLPADVRTIAALAAGPHAGPLPPEGTIVHLLAPAGPLEVRSAPLPGGVVHILTRPPSGGREHATDPLTCLADRSALVRSLERELPQTAKTGSVAALICINVDRFRDFNETLGFDAGSEILCAVAKRLKTCLGDRSLAARFGGDTFAVLASGLQSEDEAACLADRLARGLRAPVDVAGRRVFVGTSLGMALAPRHATEPAALRLAAEAALAQAKADGGACWRLFSPGLRAELRARQQLEIDLRSASQRNELSLIYQPVVRLPERRVVGYEGLLRWTHAERGAIPPEAFIPMAEETGLILPIGDWVLERACRDALRWPEPVSVSVNVSAVQLLDPGFAARTEDILARTGLLPGRLVLEVTETALLDLRSGAMERLAPLRQRGVRLALDDFGTGYSAWTYLRSGVFDLLKIDRSFAAALDEPNSVAILGALLDLAHRLGIDTVVEGIETEAQLATLAEQGCTLVQGHLTGVAVPAASVAR